MGLNFAPASALWALFSDNALLYLQYLFYKRLLEYANVFRRRDYAYARLLFSILADAFEVEGRAAQRLAPRARNKKEWILKIPHFSRVNNMGR